MQLRLSTRTIDGVLIVDCGGRIVFGEESAALRDTVKKLIPDNKRIVLNLGGVNYIDSGGLGALVGPYTTAHNCGGAFQTGDFDPPAGGPLETFQTLPFFPRF